MKIALEGTFGQCSSVSERFSVENNDKTRVTHSFPGVLKTH